MQRDDIACLHHILDAAEKAVSFVKGKARKDLDTDEMLSLSLVRLLEIIGEAANGVSLTFRDRFPHIPWRKMTGLRNRLIHGYFDINLDIVWDTILEDLPPLVKDLKAITSTENAP
ncbi:MAG: DUF86 domain-containing protein [Deltaproteobacteria bacterium]|jgi:uncharacterized protein with HEPN domain|nr:DUF86 domain-containing protein [Deltaproteobacteria bacterium]NTV57382.1 DUF86 domain-containing protein [Deltaproteobacteria bacterium]